MISDYLSLKICNYSSLLSSNLLNVSTTTNCWIHCILHSSSTSGSSISVQSMSEITPFCEGHKVTRSRGHRPQGHMVTYSLLPAKWGCLSTDFVNVSFGAPFKNMCQSYDLIGCGCFIEKEGTLNCHYCMYILYFFGKNVKLCKPFHFHPLKSKSAWIIASTSLETFDLFYRKLKLYWVVSIFLNQVLLSPPLP